MNHNVDSNEGFMSPPNEIRQNGSESKAEPSAMQQVLKSKRPKDELLFRQVENKNPERIRFFWRKQKQERESAINGGHLKGPAEKPKPGELTKAVIEKHGITMELESVEQKPTIPNHQPTQVSAAQLTLGQRQVTSPIPLVAQQPRYPPTQVTVPDPGRMQASTNPLNPFAEPTLATTPATAGASSNPFDSNIVQNANPFQPHTYAAAPHAQTGGFGAASRVQVAPITPQPQLQPHNTTKNPFEDED